LVNFISIAKVSYDGERAQRLSRRLLYDFQTTTIGRHRSFGGEQLSMIVKTEAKLFVDVSDL
jgi:hypothetical protein